MPGGGVKGQFNMNKWIPPDFNPDFLPKKEFDKYKQNDVRMMLPFTFKCDHCGNYHYIGTKLNMRKEKVLNVKYMETINYHRFYFKCLYCDREILMRTDPKNYDYILEYGGTRLYQAWKDARNSELEMVRIRQTDDLDAINKLVNKAADVKREQIQLEDIDDLTYLSRQAAKVSHEDMMDMLNKEKEDSLKYKEATGTLSREEAEGIQKKREAEGFFEKEDLEYLNSKLPSKKLKSDSGDMSTIEGLSNSEVESNSKKNSEVIEEVEIELDEEEQQKLADKNAYNLDVSGKLMNEKDDCSDDLRKEIYERENACKKNLQLNNLCKLKKKESNNQLEYKVPLSRPKKNEKKSPRKLITKSSAQVDYSDEDCSSED